MTPENLVATTLAQSNPVPPGGASMYADQVSWIATAAASAIAAILWLRRKTSRDSTEIARDRAEEDLIGTLRAERDRAMKEAREAWERRTKDAEEIARLRSQNEYLQRDVEALRQQLAEVRRHVGLVTTEPERAHPQLPAPAAGA